MVVSRVLRRSAGGLMAAVLMCAAGCAAFSNAAPTSPAAALNSVSTVAPGDGSYTGIHWVATQLTLDGVTRSIPTAMAVTVDFLESGSVIFSDGVNVVDALWAPLTAQAVRLELVGSSGVGYAGRDPDQLAAMSAMQQLTSPSDAGNRSSSEITVTRTGDTLTLTDTGVWISYRTAGPTAPELTRSALATTASPVRSSSPQPTAGSPVAGETPTAVPYDLLTHCGIREAMVADRYYLASPALDDGNGNPPTGWDNPYDSGTMTINPDETADFHDAVGHRAHFVPRPGATNFLYTCA